MSPSAACSADRTRERRRSKASSAVPRQPCVEIKGYFLDREAPLFVAPQAGGRGQEAHMLHRRVLEDREAGTQVGAQALWIEFEVREVDDVVDAPAGEASDLVVVAGVAAQPVALVEKFVHDAISR